LDFSEIVESLKITNLISHEFFFDSPGLSNCYYKIDFTLITDVKGKPNQILARANDVTDLKNAEQRINSALELAHEANQAKGQFLANMSHEIRTPMNAVVGLVEVLQQTKLDNNQHEMLNIIAESGHSLLQVINDILDFSKIDSGKLELEILPADPSDLIEQVSGLLDVTAIKKDVEISLAISPNLPRSVSVDSLRLKQILINLLGNAIKFSGQPTETGRVEMSAFWNPISDSNGELIVRVKDNGIGMSHEEQTRLFRAFVQANSTTTRQFGGTGLGLTIVKMLLDAMQGSIQIESEKGHGASFTIRLPLNCNHEFQNNEISEYIKLVNSQRTTSTFICDSGSPALAYAQHLKAAGVDFSCMSIENLITLGPISNENFGFKHIWVVDIRHDPESVFKILSLIEHLPTEHKNLLLLNHGTRRQPVRTLLSQCNEVTEIDINSLFRVNFWRAVAQAIGYSLINSNVRSTTELLTLSDKNTLSSLRILVAEDNIANQKVIQLQMEKIGIMPVIVSDGVEAFDAFKLQSWDLLLTDLHMPKMDGYGLTTSIRQYEKINNLSQTPILALTSNIVKEEGERCRQLGMNDFLTKPISIKFLKEKIEYWAKPIATPVPTSESQNTAINLSILHEYVGPVDDNALEELLLALKKDVIDGKNQLNQMFSESAHHEIKVIAHKMKSSTRYLGATELSDLCAKLETLSLESQPIDDSLINKFNFACDQVLSFIDHQ
jgi:signal transduction histidine kinase/CheY-like chemotaxis protein/HPt (histidine-containing phosphotransfer) domain-containing protein